MSLVLQDQLVLSPATADHLQEEIDTIEAGSDVTDVVGTYEDLENYDTSALTDKDVIKVLDDETRNHAQTYYRWSASAREFSYVGQIAKPAVDSVNGKTGDVVLNKSDVGLGNVDNTSDANKPVSTAQQTALNEKVSKTATASQVYGTDANGAQTTYNKDDFGQVDDVQVNGVSVVTNKIANVTIPDPLPSQSGNAGKFLKTNGTNASWGDALVNLTKGTGISSLSLLNDTGTGQGGFINIGASSNVSANGAVKIGMNGNSSGENSVAIGSGAQSTAKNAIQLGHGSSSTVTNSDANTFKVANENGNYEIMSADGTIPEARLADTTSATAGQVLQLDSNSNAIWADVDSLPDQTSQAGKILGTDGTNAAWETKTTVSFRTWGVNE